MRLFYQNTMVVMKRSDYDEKMRGMLDNTTTYSKLQKDPTATQEARIVRKQQGINEEHLH